MLRAYSLFLIAIWGKLHASIRDGVLNTEGCRLIIDEAAFAQTHCYEKNTDPKKQRHAKAVCETEKSRRIQLTESP